MVDFVPQVAPLDTSLSQQLLSAGNARAALQAKTMSDLGQSVASLGQIPAQVQQQAAVKQNMALEAARANREQTLADLQQKAYQYSSDQRQRATDFIKSGALKNFDPATITQQAAAAGMDEETTGRLLATGKTVQDSTIATVDQQQKHLATMMKALYPVVGTPMEAGAVSAMVDSTRQQEDLGIVPKGSADKFTQLWQGTNGDPIAKKTVLTQGIMNSPEVAKEAQGDIWKVTETAPGATATVGMGVGGGGTSFTAPPKLPDDVASFAHAMFPGVTSYSPDQLTAATNRAKESAVTAEDKQRLGLESQRFNFEQNKYQRELSGTPDSERAAKEYDKNVKDLQTTVKPWQDTAATAASVRQNLDRAAATGDKQAVQAALEGLVGLASPAGGRPRMNLQLIHGQLGEQQFVDKAQNLLNQFKLGKSSIIDPEQLKDMYAAVDQYESKSGAVLGAYKQTRGALSTAGVDDQRKIMDSFTDQQSKIVAPPKDNSPARPAGVPEEAKWDPVSKQWKL